MATTIEEARFEKIKLEREISKLLKEFTEKTGLEITYIDVTPVKEMTIDHPQYYHIQVTAALF